jgi:hypothetical protein
MKDVMHDVPIEKRNLFSQVCLDLVGSSWGSPLKGGKKVGNWD